jgi:sterol desaturase/sphingolipid hydroxylase (fatty acid hydroxylase superfamily)
MITLLSLLLFIGYIEHMVIFWYYSLIWSIKNRQRLTKEAILVALYALKIQLFVLPPLGLLFSYYYTDESVMLPPEFSFHELGQWVAMFLWEDFVFYHIHRLLHHPQFYHLHKLHHSWKQPVPWDALYSSVHENVMVNFFPVLSAPLIVELNIYYLLVWIAIATLSSVIAHSNFNNPHTLHHKYFNVNYGATRLFDVIYGTDMR